MATLIYISLCLCVGITFINAIAMIYLCGAKEITWSRVIIGAVCLVSSLLAAQELVW